MSKTAVADVIVPQEFEKYVIERTAELARFGQSGIIAYEMELDDLAAGGGQTVKMPYFKDLIGNRQILSDSAALSVNKITAGQDIARIQNDGNSWSVNLLARWLSAADPMMAIATLLAQYWARQDELMLISSLKGMFAAASMAPNLLSIKSESIAGQSSATRLNGSTFIDAVQRLGDRGSDLSTMVVHSATEAALRKQDLIDFVPDSQGKDLIQTFQGRRVIVDDTLPVRAGTTDGLVYTSYLFGPGAFGKGTARLSERALQNGFGSEAVEFARLALEGDDILINRRRYILHPRGVKFTSAVVAGDSPTNTELENSTNWELVWETKNVRIVAIVHNN